jgi:threonine synthase
MDIAKASNFERLVCDIHGGDGAAVEALWEQLGQSGRFDLSAHREFRRLGDWIMSGSSSHAERIETIRRVAAADGVVIDPHTADGVHVGRQQRIPGPLMCLETALPAKFGATIVEALGQHPPRPAAFVGLEERPRHVTVIDADVAAVRAAIEDLAARMLDRSGSLP